LTVVFIALVVLFHCIVMIVFFLFISCGVFATFPVIGLANSTPYLVSRFGLRIVITIVFIAIVLDVVNSMSLNRDGFQ